ncbi:unnamed protein product [Anisakis simplex]|uniref:Uncharacterized protein n=1 Tax=Anisakis simplex TaxID=6269 RepID=A0A0M3KFP7_ANISI|nr:unnamed protein product [Anisakis simplex]
MGLDAATEICLGEAMRGPLPELRDDLDEFFRAVECPSTSSVTQRFGLTHSNAHEAETPCKPKSSLPIGATLTTSALHSAAPCAESESNSYANRSHAYDRCKRLADGVNVKQECLSEADFDYQLIAGLKPFERTFHTRISPHCQFLIPDRNFNFHN